MKLSFISTSKRLGSKLISHVKGDTCSNNTNSTNTGVCPDSSVRRVQTVSISNSCSTLTNEAADDDRRLTHTISISNSVSTKVDHCTMPPKTNVRRSRFSASSSASPRQLNNDSTQHLDYNIASSQSWSSEDDHVLFSSSLNELANDRNSLEEAPFTELTHCVSKEFTKHKGPSFRHSVTSTSKRLAQLCRQKTRQFKNLHTKLKQSVTGNSASSSRRSSTISNAGIATTVADISTNSQTFDSLSQQKTPLQLTSKRILDNGSFESFEDAREQHYKRVRLSRALDIPLSLPLDVPCTPLRQIISEPQEAPSLEYLWADRSHCLNSVRSIESSVVTAAVSVGIPGVVPGQSLLSTADDILFPPTPSLSPAFPYGGGNHDDDEFSHNEQIAVFPPLTNSMHAMSRFTQMCQSSVSNADAELGAIGGLGSPFLPRSG